MAHSRNHLLASLCDEDFGFLSPLLTTVDLQQRDPLEIPNEAVEHVYFVTSGMGSTVALTSTGARIEVGVFGREGMSGGVVVMGNDRSPNESFVQMPGSAERIAADDLRMAMENCGAIRPLLTRYVQALMVQAQHTALSNGSGKLEERLSRWLVMCHDRAEGDDLPLTHEFLALMLGVRRTGVTLALHILEGHGFIRARRGLVHVLDRDGLIENAHGSYGVPEAEYRRLLG